MAVTDVAGMVLQVGQIAVWLKAAGIAAVIWLIFESIALWLNYKRWRDVGNIKEDMKRLEGKLDRILKKR